jgi:hypothetical protein
MPRLPGAGAPKGNQNAASKKPWAAAIERALAKRSLKSKRDALDDLAEKLLKACDKGDVTALKELADRMDGKSIQHIDAQVETNVTVELVRFADIAPK